MPLLAPLFWLALVRFPCSEIYRTRARITRLRSLQRTSSSCDVDVRQIWPASLKDRAKIEVVLQVSFLGEYGIWLRPLLMMEAQGQITLFDRREMKRYLSGQCPLIVVDLGEKS